MNAPLEKNMANCSRCCTSSPRMQGTNQEKHSIPLQTITVASLSEEVAEAVTPLNPVLLTQCNVKKHFISRHARRGKTTALPNHDHQKDREKTQTIAKHITEHLDTVGTHFPTKETLDITRHTRKRKSR